ncbi:phage regulatory CII family protein [Pelomonas sp. Root1444]|uniref:phage regulatory CII family protein n=1 Tax=Pelomonas sp. Root1444 TaxID=1736464 RepID=UPI0007032FC3|nr:phage regulatory CII family protein [Pelomonas sp. Root1444]KQY83714.1 hypothetical protein ASD35_24135 [Pelomonas sp. Root1444]
MSPLLIAARAIAKHYPGGAAGLGRDMGGKTNLADELNPNLPKSKLGLEDAVEMEILANDYRILYEHCAMTRHFPALPMPEGFDMADDQCMRTLSETAKEFSDVVSSTAMALSDGVVSDNDLAQVTREWSELIVKGQALMQQLSALNARLKARSA